MVEGGFETLVLRAAEGIALPAGAVSLGARKDVLGDAAVHTARLGDAALDAYVLESSRLVLAQRLARLGAAGIGGFLGGGTTDDGRVVLLRKRITRSAADLSAGERLSGERVLALVVRFATALVVLEEGSLQLGPLRLADAVIDEDQPYLVGETLVRALLGAPAERTGTTAPSPRWTPPEQADGAAWDAAANRYVLGLLAYRMIGGEHPFAGAGLRHVHSAGDAPPFEESVARALAPGVQAFVLSLLRVEKGARPANARAIADAARRLLAGETPDRAAAAAPRAVVPDSRPSVAESAAPVPVPTIVPSRSQPLHIAVAIACFAVAVLAWVFAPKASARGPAVTVSARAPVTGRSAEACAPCHAKQVEEWRRSVMAFSSRSPLYRALESAVEEQVGRDDTCPGGAGVLRKRGANACVEQATGLPLTGSGGEHWCVHCHAPADQLASRVPTWNATGAGVNGGRSPLGDVLSPEALEGITCVACHTSVGPVGAHAARRSGVYEGNPVWTSTKTGLEFSMRPEDLRGVFGIANSGYRMDPAAFFVSAVQPNGPMVHAPIERGTDKYLRSSEFCGACHDVRLFGSDVLGARDRGEHFKRLRNAYSEWRDWSDAEARAGRRAASCQDCHMSLFPGVCVAGASRSDPRSETCPPGAGFVAKSSGTLGGGSSKVPTHYFTGVEVPFSADFPERAASDGSLDAEGIPIGLRPRRDLLLKTAFSMVLGAARTSGDTLEVPLEITNVGAGHRVPAGFSQEREFWVEFRVIDARGRVVYEVGKIDRPDQDLRDKVFIRVNTDDRQRDGRGRPLGVFGADVIDGPDVGQWSPNPQRGGTRFRGKGLINFQNGFLRCVRCIGVIGPDGACLPGPDQGRTRADRFVDGDYDADTGECRSNLSGGNELFETYYPIGALDADRGVLRAPDAIIDTRSAPPGVPLQYTYVLNGLAGRPRPLQVEAKLRFRAFPPFLIRAFASYERERAARGERPGGAQVVDGMLGRLDIVDLVTVRGEVP